MRLSVKLTIALNLSLMTAACSTLPAKEKSVSVAPFRTLNPTYSDSFQTRTEADSLFILADIYSREEKSEKAIELFEKVAALDPSSPYVRARLSAEYSKVNKWSEAITNAEQAVAKDPSDVDARLLLGDLYSKEKKYEQAIDQYTSILRLQPENNEVPIYIAGLYMDQKDYKKAEHSFTSVLKNKTYATPYLTHYYLGLMHLEQYGPQHLSAAEQAFKRSLRLRPDFEDAVISLANLYVKQNRREQALALCLKYQKEQNFKAKVAHRLAQIYIDGGETDKAYGQFEIIAAHSPASLDVQLKMALILIEQKKYQQAALKLKEIVTQFPTADGARYYLAAMQEQNGDLDSAVSNYESVPATSTHFTKSIVRAAFILKGMGKINQALSLTEKGLKTRSQPQVYTMHASLLDAKSDYLGAARVLEEGLAKYSDNAELLFRHALILDRLGKKDSMMAQMQKVLAIEPDHIQSMNYLAFSMAELNHQLPEAEKLARRALMLSPQDGYILDTLGWVLFKQKKYSDSIGILEQAYQYQSSSGVIAEHLADAYAMQLLNEKAKVMYNIAAGLTKDQVRSQEIRDKLARLL